MRYSLFFLMILSVLSCSKSSDTSKITIKGIGGYSTQNKNASTDGATIIDSCPTNSTAKKYTNLSEGNFVYFTATGKFGRAAIQVEKGVVTIKNSGALKISYSSGDANLEIPSGDNVSFFAITSKEYRVATNAEKVEEYYWSSKTVASKPGSQVVDLPLTYKGYKQTVKLFLKIYDGTIPVQGPLSVTVFDPATGLFTNAEDVGHYESAKPGLYEFDFPSGLPFSIQTSSGKTLFSFNDINEIYNLSETQMRVKGIYSISYKSNQNSDSCYTTPSDLIIGYGVSVDPNGDENADGILNQDSLDNDIDPFFSRDSYGGYYCPFNQTCPTTGSINLSLYPSTQSQTINTSEVNSNGMCPERTVKITNNTDADIQYNYWFETDSINDEIYGIVDCGNPYLQTGGGCTVISKNGGEGFAKVRFCPRTVGNKTGWVSVRSGNVRSNVLAFTGISQTQNPVLSNIQYVSSFYAKPGQFNGSLTLGYAVTNGSSKELNFISNAANQGVFANYFNPATKPIMNIGAYNKDISYEVIPPIVLQQDVFGENLIFTQSIGAQTYLYNAYRNGSAFDVSSQISGSDIFNVDREITNTKMEWAYSGGMPTLFHLAADNGYITCILKSYIVGGINPFTVENSVTSCLSPDLSSDHSDIAFSYIIYAATRSAKLMYKHLTNWTSTGNTLGSDIYNLDNDISWSSLNDSSKSIYTIHKEIKNAIPSIVVSEINVNDLVAATDFHEFGRFTDDISSGNINKLRPQIAVLNDIPYIAYLDNLGNINVKRYTYFNGSTKQWQSVSSFPLHLNSLVEFSLVKDQIHQKLYIVSQEVSGGGIDAIYTYQIR